MEGDFIESIDDAWPRCAPSATLSHLCFLFDLHHKDRVFVVSGGGRLVGHVDASEVGRALAAKMPAQETSNPMRDASAAYWRGRRAQRVRRLLLRHPRRQSLSDFGRVHVPY